MTTPLTTLFARLTVTLLLAACVGLSRGVRGWQRLFGRRREPRPTRTLLLAGTFYNVGWFESHIRPLVACGTLARILVVCDEPLLALDKVTYVAPPRWARRLLGRAGARAVWLARTAWCERPDVLMGYHIMPNALLCLVLARLCGGQAIYQMTGGPVQILGGGFGSENGLLRRLGRPSRRREALMLATVREFDGVIVRGRQARQFLRTRGLSRRVAVLPGSVDCERFAPGAPRTNGAAKPRYDLVCVGRLVPVKRYDRVLNVVAALRERRPATCVAIVGDGPLLAYMQERAAWLDLAANVRFVGRRDDVVPYLRRARAFLMTSENEGLSIAMMEAMAAGLPVLAPNVGDLAELLIDGQTGLFINPDAPEAAAHLVAALLDDPARLAAMSRAARDLVVQRASVPAVAQLWDEYFTASPAAEAEAEMPPLPAALPADAPLSSDLRLS